MSASEKLKALAVEYEADHGWDSGPYGIAQHDVERRLAAALPQLAAVVEAAEFGYSQLSQEYDAWPELRAALTALDR